MAKAKARKKKRSARSQSSKKSKQQYSGSKVAYIYMSILSVFYLLVLAALIIATIYFKGYIPNIGAEGEEIALTPLSSILLIVWAGLISWLVHFSGKLMSSKETLVKGIIASVLLTIASFSLLPLIGGIIGLISLLNKKSK